MQPHGEMDGCTVALPAHIEPATQDFRLPPLECEVRVADQKSDISNKLLSSLKRSGWLIRVSMFAVISVTFTAESIDYFSNRVINASGQLLQ